MSWSIHVAGRDKEKLKEAVREQQCKDEVNSPHNGVPARVVDYLCKEIDRVRVYEFNSKKWAIFIEAWGSFHEQGSSETVNVKQHMVVE